MAFTGDFMCSSFKVEILTALHDFTTTTGDVFKMALYDNTATLTAATTIYPAGRRFLILRSILLKHRNRRRYKNSCSTLRSRANR